MTDQEWIQQQLASAPALTEEQRSRLSSILSRPAPDAQVLPFLTPTPSRKAA